MNNLHQVDRPDLIKILDVFGKGTCENKKEYNLTSLTTSSSNEGDLIDFSLYILAPEISYEYRVINVERLDVTTLRIRFYTLATKQSESYDVDISKGTTEFQNKLSEISKLGLFKLAVESLIHQIQLKRESRTSPIRNKIIPGQARVAILTNGQHINVGWIEIIGDEVFYYTGQGLREMWKPSMSKEEQDKADYLKQLDRKELIDRGYIAKNNVSEFKDIL